MQEDPALRLVRMLATRSAQRGVFDFVAIDEVARRLGCATDEAGRIVRSAAGTGWVKAFGEQHPVGVSLRPEGLRHLREGSLVGRLGQVSYAWRRGGGSGA